MSTTTKDADNITLKYYNLWELKAVEVRKLWFSLVWLLQVLPFRLTTEIFSPADWVSDAFEFKISIDEMLKIVFHIQWHFLEWFDYWETGRQRSNFSSFVESVSLLVLHMIAQFNTKYFESYFGLVENKRHWDISS